MRSHISPDRYFTTHYMPVAAANMPSPARESTLAEWQASPGSSTALAGVALLVNPSKGQNPTIQVDFVDATEALGFVNAIPRLVKGTAQVDMSNNNCRLHISGVSKDGLKSILKYLGGRGLDVTACVEMQRKLVSLYLC